MSCMYNVEILYSHYTRGVEEFLSACMLCVCPSLEMSRTSSGPGLT